MSVSILFSLLHHFSKTRNRYAPVIYKAMTFLLIECYDSNEMRQEILQHFIKFFSENPNVPPGILCEPLFEQIKINFEKQQAQSQQVESTNLQANIAEMDLFMRVAEHPKLTEGIASGLLEVGCELARRQIIYTRVALKLVLTVLKRFQQNEVVLAKAKESVNQYLEVIVAQDAQKIALT